MLCLQKRTPDLSERVTFEIRSLVVSCFSFHQTTNLQPQEVDFIGQVYNENQSVTSRWCGTTTSQRQIYGCFLIVYEPSHVWDQNVNVTFAFI